MPPEFIAFVWALWFLIASIAVAVLLVGWRVMRALERIASAMEVRPPTQA